MTGGRTIYTIAIEDDMLFGTILAETFKTAAGMPSKLGTESIRLRALAEMSPLILQTPKGPRTVRIALFPAGRALDVLNNGEADFAILGDQAETQTLPDTVLAGTVHRLCAVFTNRANMENGAGVDFVSLIDAAHDTFSRQRSGEMCRSIGRARLEKNECYYTRRNAGLKAC